MPEYNIVVDGKPYKIELTKTGEESRFTVKVNEKSFNVTLTGKFDYKTPFPIKVGEKLYQVEVSKSDQKAPYSVKVNNVLFRSEVKAPARHVTEELVLSPTMLTMKKPLKKIAEEGVVIAPMAGKIVSVNVRKGDPVKTGDVVCILEAMKMENEITASKTGVVQEVNVSEGSAVSEGDILFTIK